MKTNSFGSKPDEATNLETLKMTIDEGSIDHLMSNLTNLYSQPELAVFREYVSNALDSHTKAGKLDTPIKVTLENGTSWDYKLVVEDFGVGMSKQDISDIYSRYGRSTKNDNNAEIGGFGLGAKSALAITDRFDAVSVKDGQEVVFYVKKNNKGVGVIHFVSETTTTADNGFKVTIPLTHSQFSTMSNDASKFFRTWKSNSVIFNGELNSRTIHETELFLPVTSAGQPLAWVSLDKTNRNANTTDLASISFIIGGIRYGLPNVPEAFRERIGRGSQLDENFRNIVFSNAEIYINLPIGSVDLTPSRESLMMTEKTISTIESLVNDFINEAPAQFEGFINTLDRGEAYSVYANKFSFFAKPNDANNKVGYYYGSKPKPVGDNSGVFWRGEEMPNKATISNSFFVYSVEGRAVPDVASAKSIDLFQSARSSYKPSGSYSEYEGLAQIIVTADKIDEAHANEMRKNLRDYCQSEFGHKQAIAHLLKKSEINDWIEATHTIVSLDELVKSAKDLRKVKRSNAQTGVKRASVKYVVLDLSEATPALAHISQDTLTDHNLIYSEAGGRSWSVASTAHDFSRNGGNGKVSDDSISMLRSVFGVDKKIVLLTAGKSVSAFQKRYPTSVSIDTFLNEKIADVMGGKDKALFEALMELEHNGTTLRNNLTQIVTKGRVSEIESDFTRQVAIEVADTNSALSSLVLFARDLASQFSSTLNKVVSHSYSRKPIASSFVERYAILNISAGGWGYRRGIDNHEIDQAILFINASDKHYN